LKRVNNEGIVAFIHPEAKIGKNVAVWHFTYIGRGTKIGANSMVGSLVHIDQDVMIGRNCRIQGNVYVPPGTVIGNNVFLGPACVLLNDKYPPSGGVLRAPIIEDDVTIGGNSTICPDVKIGRGAVVGAGSLVTKDVPTLSVVYGSPARTVMTKKEYVLKQKTWKKKNSCGKMKENFSN
jgi:acetyltransferase-like isoleucine patch superfamily enzyme